MKIPDYEILLIKKSVMYIYKHDVINVALDAEYPYFDSEIPYMIGIDIATIMAIKQPLGFFAGACAVLTATPQFKHTT